MHRSFIIRNDLITSNNLTIPKLFMVAFNTVAKPLMPEKIQKMINFHSDFQSLHEFVSKDVLPEELGGNTGKFDNSICVKQSKTMEQYFKNLKSED